MATQFPDVLISWTDLTSSVVAPGTQSGTYTISVPGIVSGSITDNGDNTYTLILTNLKTVSFRTVTFPWQNSSDILGDSQADDIHYIPFRSGYVLWDNMMIDFSGISFTYPGSAFAPVMIRADSNYARLVANVDWPPKKCDVGFSRGRNYLIYYDYITTGQTLTVNAMYLKISGTDTLSSPMWMQALDYYKTWLNTKLVANNLSPITYPAWIKNVHGYYNVQLENDASFLASTYQTNYNKWKEHLPWMQFWGQMTAYGIGCCSRITSIDPRFVGLTTLSASIASAGGHVGFYTKVPDIEAEYANYIPIDNVSQKIDDTPTVISTITDNSVILIYGNVLWSTGAIWSASIASGDIVHLTSVSVNLFVQVVRKGSASDGDASFLYIYPPASFYSGLNASVNRYSGGTQTSLAYLQTWLANSIGGSSGGNAAYIDVLGTISSGEPLTVANYIKNGNIDNNSISEMTSQLMPLGGLLSGSVTLNERILQSSNGDFHITSGSNIITRTSIAFDARIAEWDTIQVSTGDQFIVDTVTPAKQRGLWYFSTNTSSGPPNTYIRFNNTTYGSVTTIYINDVGTDSFPGEIIFEDSLLSSLTSGSYIRIYKNGDITTYFYALINSSIDSGAYHTLSVTYYDSRNSFASNEQLNVEFYFPITSIKAKTVASATISGANFIIYRHGGYPTATLSNVRSYIDNAVSYLPFLRYLQDDKILFLGQSNTDYWFWGAYNGANYFIERTAFLNGMKFDAIIPGETNASNSWNQVLLKAIQLRDNVDWWSRFPKYKHTYGISSISNTNVDIRRFTDTNGYELFVVDNWTNLTSGTFMFSGVTYNFTSDGLQIIDTQPPTPPTPDPSGGGSSGTPSFVLVSNNDNSIINSGVTYEIEYTENYVGDSTNWHTVKRRIPYSQKSYEWIVGKMIKSNTVRLRMRAKNLLTEKSSDWSISNQFSINVFNLIAPSIVNPVSNKAYNDSILIILDETLTKNTYHQKVRYKLEYSSIKSGKDWTIIRSNIPFGQNVIKWDIGQLNSSDDYTLRLTAENSSTCLNATPSQPDQFAQSFIYNIQIQQSGAFLIDTKPPEAILQIKSINNVTNQLDQIIDIFAEDETTQVEQIQLRECNANNDLSLGDIQNPYNPSQDCPTIESLLSGNITDFNNLIGKSINNSHKVKWSFKDISGLKKLEALLIDSGGNSSIQELSRVFLNTFTSDNLINDFIIVMEQRDNITLNENSNPPSLVILPAIFEIVYLGTSNGNFYVLEPFSRLLYTVSNSPSIVKLAQFNQTVYLFTYKLSSDEGKVYRNDNAEPTLLYTFTSNLSLTTSLIEFDNKLYIGLENGELWVFNGITFVLLRTFDDPVNALGSDKGYLYIGFQNSSNIYLYDGSSFNSSTID